jgi:predicted metal-dependent hydrolase
MQEVLELGELKIHVAFKKIKNVHLSVYPPDGRVVLVAPETTRLEVVRAYAISKLDWIRSQQDKFMAQARETSRQYINRESHMLWGRQHLLSVIEREEKPSVQINHKSILLTVRQGSSEERRAEVIHEWHITLLHEIVPGLIQKWESKLGVKAKGYHLQRMKTKWGSFNPKSGFLRLNTELVKKPKDLLEYVIVHELIHLIEPTHSERFREILSTQFPAWNEARLELNELPLGAEKWKE